MGRYVAIWFRHLPTDWFTVCRDKEFLKTTGKSLHRVPFVLRAAIRGRMVITATNAEAEKNGITKGMALADARAIFPALVVFDDKPELPEKLLKRIAEWCIRFTPFVSVDLPDGLFLDATGCTHLWGGDKSYLDDIERKLSLKGYDIRLAIADTPGVAWALARFGKNKTICAQGEQLHALLPLPPAALRVEQEVVERLHKLGLHTIRQFITIPRQSLRRRFGTDLLRRIDQAVGNEMELLEPILLPDPYQERLPCIEPVATRAGIEIALKNLLAMICKRLENEQKGIRHALFKAYRIDNKVEQVSISTTRPSNHADHLYKLFELNLTSIEPSLGIELFTLDCSGIEDHLPQQARMWKDSQGLEDIRIAELIDRVAVKIGSCCIKRFLPDEHYWPERSVKVSSSLVEEPSTSWRADKLRPVLLLKQPEKIEVTAPIPDYPPMLFIRKGKIHKVIKADGPERIEREWWIEKGQHRDYYRVEDEEGHRFWIFRLGHYDKGKYQWFLHGFFP